MSTIVLVEPIQIVRYSLKNRFIQSGYHVYDFHSVNHLLTQLDLLEHADLLIWGDHYDNKESIEIFKKIQSKKNVPIFLITTELRREEMKEFIKFGVVDFIIRPFNHEDLVERIKKITPISSITIQAEEFLRYEVALADRGEYPISIFLIEIVVGTQHDYNYALKMMKKLKNECKKIFRSTDMIFEFGAHLMLILPFTPRSGVPVVSRKLIDHMKKNKQDTFSLQIRFGYASYPEDCKDHQELLRLAKKRLAASSVF